MRLPLILSWYLLISPAMAQVINYQTDSFAAIAAEYKRMAVDPKTTLMVFDLDDTLITMTQPLGSVGWWDWQYELLKKGGVSDKLFTKDYQHLVRIQNLLFHLVKMEVTDEYVIPFLKESGAQGAMLIGLSARGDEHLSATLMQLKYNQFTVNDKGIFRTFGLKFENNQSSVADNFYCPEFTREVFYHQGIMFLNGEDKGKALLCIISKSNQAIKTILFVDDAQRNISSVAKAFEDRSDILVLNVQYTKENAKELEVQTNPNIQAELFDQWNLIKKSLNDVIIQSHFNDAL